MKKKTLIIPIAVLLVALCSLSSIASAATFISCTGDPSDITVVVEKSAPVEYIEMPIELPASYTPDWKLGDWWVVKTDFHPPERAGEHRMFKYKYVVVKCEEVVSKEGNQKTFYKVRRTAADRCCEDLKYWTNLYFVKNNPQSSLSLYRAETYHRDNKTTEAKEYDTIDNPAPVMGYPCSVPVFPLTTEKRVQRFELIERCNCANTPMQKIEQEVLLYDKLYHVVGKRIFATTYKVKLTDEYGDSLRQYWHPSAPWAICEDSATWTSTLLSCSEWEISELPKKSSKRLKE
jgi:hypothetical protein